MVASAVFITDLQGKSIISRNYRGDVPLNRAIERFTKYLQDTPDELKKPIFYVDSSGDCLVEEDVGGTGGGGESYIYIAVRDVRYCWCYLAGAVLLGWALRISRAFARKGTHRTNPPFALLDRSILLHILTLV